MLLKQLLCVLRQADNILNRNETKATATYFWSPYKYFFLQNWYSIRNRVSTTQHRSTCMGDQVSHPKFETTWQGPTFQKAPVTIAEMRTTCGVWPNLLWSRPLLLYILQYCIPVSDSLVEFLFLCACLSTAPNRCAVLIAHPCIS